MDPTPFRSFSQQFSKFFDSHCVLLPSIKKLTLMNSVSIFKKSWENGLQGGSKFYSTRCIYETMKLPGEMEIYKSKSSLIKLKM